MPNRIQFDIQGSIYTLPINPYSITPIEANTSSQKNTVDGPYIRVTPYFETKPMVMSWKDLDDRSKFVTMLSTLRSAVGISGVKVNFRDTDPQVYGWDIWRDMRVDDVEFRYLQGGEIGYNLDVKLSHQKWNIDTAGIALFTYQPGDYSDPDWLSVISGGKSHLHTIVCNADLGTLNVNGLRAAFPDAKLLMYFNNQDHHMHTFTNSAFYDVLNARTIQVSGYLFTLLTGPDAGDQIQNLAGAAPTNYEGCNQPGFSEQVIYAVSGNCMGTLDTTAGGLIPSNPAYAGFEYDGVYVDMFTKQYQPNKADALQAIIDGGVTIDADNDSVAESVAEIQVLYAQGRNYMMSGLRDSLGPDKIILGNSSGDSQHPGVNGFTFESITIDPPVPAYIPDVTTLNAILRNQDKLCDVSPKYHICWTIALPATLPGIELEDFCKTHTNVLFGHRRDNLI